MLSGLADSVFHSLILHTDGYLYAFPQTLSGNRNKKVLRCSITGNLSDCALFGQDLDTNSADLDIIQGVVQVPTRDEVIILGSNNLKVYKFSTDSSAMEELEDLSSLGVVNVGYWGVRNLIIEAVEPL